MMEMIIHFNLRFGLIWRIPPFQLDTVHRHLEVSSAPLSLKNVNLFML